MGDLRVVCPDCGQVVVVREDAQTFRCLQCGGIAAVKDNEEKSLLEELKKT